MATSLRPLRKQSGVAAVELGILLIPLVLLVFGITEFGRALYQYNTLVKSTRNAARYLSQQGPGDPADIYAATCLAVHGSVDCSGTVLVPGLTADMVTICDATSCPATHNGVPTGSGAVNLVTVTISDDDPDSPNAYPFESLVPFVVESFSFGPISATMRQIS